MDGFLGIPRVALVLGLGGVIPFATAAVLAFFGIGQLFGLPVGTMTVIYAVAILSFLGGVRWGIALSPVEPAKRDRDLVIAVVPALVGWAAAALPNSQSLPILVLAFLLLGAFDLFLAAPGWYRTLRILLTVLVVLCLGIAWSLGI